MKSIHNYYHVFVLISTIISYIIVKRTNKDNSLTKNLTISLYTPIILYIAYYFVLYLQDNIDNIRSNDMSDIYQSSISI